MRRFRGIPLSAHAGIEALAGPLLMAAPFVLGFGQAATIVSVAVGALLIALALQVPGPARAIPIAHHASFDYALAMFAAVAGLALGLTTGAWGQAVFLVGTGAALVALAAATRFSAPRGA